MQFFTDNVMDQLGNAQPGMSVLVSKNGSPATIYSDNGVTPATNPLTTNAKGDFTFFAPDGDYVVSPNGLTSQTVRLFDSSPFWTPSADAAGLWYVPKAGATFTGSASGAALAGSYWGPGRITTNDGNKRAYRFRTITSAQTLGNHNGIDTCFNGDVPFNSDEIRITGTATLGQPATGFSVVPEACGYYGVIRNASGWNQSNSGNDGRTMVSLWRGKVFHAGRGGTNMFSGTIVMSCTDDPANTSFLANGASCVYTGDYFATVDGVYADAFEVQFHDQTHDIAVAAHVYNFDRNNNTGAKGAWWTAFRAQSIGTKPVDALMSASGLFDRGIDLSFMDFSASTLTNPNGALILSQDQRIYFKGNKSDTTGLSRFSADPSTTWMAHSSTISGLNFVVGNNSAFQVLSDHVTLPNTNLHISTAGNGIKIKEGTNGRMGVTAAMTAGSVTVANTTITANSRVLPVRLASGGTPGHVSVTLNAGTGFTLTSSSNTETSTFVYLILEAL